MGFALCVGNTKAKLPINQNNKQEFNGGLLMNVYDLIVNELFEKKSLAALIFLIDCGRELELNVNGNKCFISCDSSKKYVSIYVNKNEQSFDSVSELIENATIADMNFLLAWEQAELEFLY